MLARREGSTASRRAFLSNLSLEKYMNAPIPSEIDIDQFRLALTTFCDSLGINPMSAYFPMVITDSEVVFPCHPSRASEGRPKAIQVPADEHPQGILHGEMSTMVRIKVVR